MEYILANIVERFQGDKWVFGTCTITYTHLVKLLATMLNINGTLSLLTGLFFLFKPEQLIYLNEHKYQDLTNKVTDSFTFTNAMTLSLIGFISIGISILGLVAASKKNSKSLKGFFYSSAFLLLAVLTLSIWNLATIEENKERIEKFLRNIVFNKDKDRNNERHFIHELQDKMDCCIEGNQDDLYCSVGILKKSCTEAIYSTMTAWSLFTSYTSIIIGSVMLGLDYLLFKALKILHFEMLKADRKPQIVVDY